MRELADDEVHIQIWNHKGELVVDEIDKCKIATQDEIDDMVKMIEGGTPAYLAAIWAKQGAAK